VRQQSRCTGPRQMV